MNHEVLTAIDELEHDGVLDPAQADRFRRVAAGRLVSVQTELRLVVGIGITLTASGASLFMAENKTLLGALPVLLVIAAAALACIAWVWRKAAPFTWNETPTPVTSLDFVLQLGLLLLAAALAYGEATFHLAGTRWPVYLLAVGLIDLWAAYRFDSCTALSLGLSALAAWRGAAVIPSLSLRENLSLVDFRWNASLLGALFLLVGFLSRRLKRKPHFASVWERGGFFLLSTGAMSGTYDPSGYLPWLLLLLAAGTVTSLAGIRRRVPVDFVMGYLVFCVGVLRLLALVLTGDVFLYVVSPVIIGALALLIFSVHKMGEEP